MRIVFMGTPEFAVPSLRAVASRHDVVAVYTRPDAVSGRGRGTRPSPVALAARELGLEVEKPVSLRESGVQMSIAGHEPDVCVVAAYGLILPQEVLDIPRLGCLNVHASLPPRWRGAAPIQRAILAGDTETGVSIMRMEAGLDTGPYCEVERVSVGGTNASELTHELAEVGARSLVQTLSRIEDGSCTWTQQDESLVTYAQKVSKPDVALEPGLSASEAVRRVRASGPQAPARILLWGRPVTVISASSTTSPCVPQGSVHASPDGVVLGFADGCVLVDRLKPDGRREMAAADWARGIRLSENSRWESI